MILKIAIATILAINCLSVKTMAPMEPWESVGLSVEEFELFSGVVEAESDRNTEDIEGRIYIALTIWNRVNDTRFPDTVTGVLTQSAQFSTVRNGHAVSGRTDLSDQAVVEAYEWIQSGEAYPEVLFFNCRGYNYGEAYGLYGGNYFMTLGGIV